MQRTVRPAYFAILAVLFVGVVGCGGGDDMGDAVARANSTNIIRVANLYNAYQLRNELRGPADEAALKEFISSLDAETMRRVGVDPASPEGIFTSERDGETFKIRYGVRGNLMGSVDPIVFETTGVDGKREIGFLNMTQREVDDAEYEQLWEGKGLPTVPTRDQPQSPAG